MVFVRFYINVLLTFIIRYSASAYAVGTSLELMGSTETATHQNPAWSASPTNWWLQYIYEGTLRLLPLHLYWLKKNEPRKVEEALTVPANHQKKANNTHSYQQMAAGLDSTKILIYPFRYPPTDEGYIMYESSQDLIHFFIAHGPYQEHLHRFNLRDSDECKCGEAETPVHVVLHCPNTEDEASRKRTILRGVKARDFVNDEIPILDSLANKISKIQYRAYHR